MQKCAELSRNEQKSSGMYRDVLVLGLEHELELDVQIKRPGSVLDHHTTVPVEKAPDSGKFMQAVSFLQAKITVLREHTVKPATPAWRPSTLPL